MEAYRILPAGDLEKVNDGSINGMRGCYLSTDYEDKFLFVGGYHDGKITVLRLREDGGIGEITEEIYHKGLGDNRSGSESSEFSQTPDFHAPLYKYRHQYNFSVHARYINTGHPWKTSNVSARIPVRS